MPTTPWVFEVDKIHRWHLKFGWKAKPKFDEAQEVLDRLEQELKVLEQNVEP